MVSRKASAQSKDASSTVMGPSIEADVQLGHHSWVLSACFSPDGKYVLTGSQDGSARLWDISTGYEVRSFRGNSREIWTVAYSPSGQYILTGGLGEPAVLWDVRTGKEVRRFGETKNGVRGVAFSPDGRHVLTADYAKSVRLWDLSNGQEIIQLDGDFPNGIAAFSPDGRYLVEASRPSLNGRSLPSILRLLDANTGKEIQRFVSQTGHVNSVGFSADQRYIYSGADDHTFRLWDLATSKELKNLERSHVLYSTSAALSPDSHYALTADDGEVLLWNLDTGKQIRSFLGHGIQVTSVSFSADGKFVLSSGWDGTARLWDIKGGKEIRRFEGAVDPVKAVAFSPDGRYLVSAGEDQAVAIWNLSSGKETNRCLGQIGTVTSLAFSPDSRFIAAGHGGLVEKYGHHRGPRVVLWDRDTCAKVRTFEPDAFEVDAVTISPDGRLLLEGGPVGALKLWNLETGAFIRRFPEVSNYNTRALAISPDGTRALVVGDDIQLWNLSTGKLIRRFGLRSEEMIDAAAFSPDGRFIATGFNHALARLWDASDGRVIRSFSGHTNHVNSVSFSPDGRFILTASNDMTARIWSIANGTEVRRFVGHSGPVTTAGFAPNGKLILTGSEDGTIKLWENANVGNLLVTAAAFRDGDWVVFDQTGRFDTKFSATSLPLHWIARDEPMRALPVEIFMRSYFTPDLLQKVRNKALPAIAPLSSLNRVQPEVRIETVSAEPEEQNRVTVTVFVSQQNSSAKNSDLSGVTSSGVYDLRLFRDGQQVASWPNQQPGEPIAESSTQGLNGWRSSHQVSLDPAGNATIVFRHIALPVRSDVNTVEFTAYAFNSDRVKSLTTSSYKYTLPQGIPSVIQRKAYLITMGVNANQSRNLRLDLAISSAESVRRILRNKLVGEYQNVIEIPLYSDYDSNNQVRPNSAKKVDLRTVLDLLAGRPVDLGVWNEVDPEHKLQTATPDDAVVLYIASHGYADPEGTYYLMPYDTGSNWGVTEDLLARCTDSSDRSINCTKARDLLVHSVSGGDLASWWTGIDAGEMVMILDSCHSGAIPGREFRPGPLGDPGFGQLAYDKGMEIFSASQPAQTEKGEWISGGEGHTLLVDKLENLAQADPDETLQQWLEAMELEIPLTARELYPTLTEEAVQTPLLLDFGKTTIFKPTGR
jgi:WD40 repeat protein